ncbi:hypothetical protein OH77DRAFT_1409127 [Trametes cingulata]|nr:hypothetical protein OH77DRAFT_1409127 [Trametes cingulata]
MPVKEEEHLPNSLDEHRCALAKLANVRAPVHARKCCHTQSPFTQPKAEIKKEFLLKDEDVLQLLHPDALQPYPISLPENLRSITITRRQLSKRYGGSEMDTFPKPGAQKRAQHGRDANFMCINLLWNPHAPQVPGRGGLFFDTSLPGDVWTRSRYHSERQVLFVRLGDARWLYLGVYEVSQAPPLTSAQWCGLRDAVRAVWTKNIYQKNWGRSTRARISLRRFLGREPTHDDEEHAQGDFKEVTEEQIKEAFAAGEECICVWSMKCVDYDEDFQRELIDLARGS